MVRRRGETMPRKSASKVIDVRQACCYDTLTSPIKEAILGMKPNEVLEVIVNPSFKREFHKFVKEEGHQILEEASQEDEVHFRISMKSREQEEEGKKENCMVCGGPLEYLIDAVSATCNYCAKEESAYIRCPSGHYVCEECHGKGAYDVIKDFALSTPLRDPIEIAETMMAHPSITMLGCDNAIIAAAALSAALKNEGTLKIRDREIVEAMNRTRKQSISGYCGLTGVCGIPIAIGAVFSVILGASCPRDRESAITMHAVARVIEAIAIDVGPMCCKSFVRTAMGVGYNLAKEYLNVNLPIHREKIQCFYSKRHPHGCRESKCNYF